MGEAQKGVQEAAALQSLWSTRALILLYLAILLFANMTSLESQVNFLFIPYITSDFSSHGLLSTIQIVSAVLQTVLKAPAAKVADVFGRTQALLVGLTSFALGYLCMSVSTNFWWYAASQIFYVGGITGMQFLLQLIVADTSTLANRALIACIPTAPFLWNVWIGPPLGSWLLDDLGWRWGTAIWMVIVPLSAVPLLIGLMSKSRQLKRKIAEEEAAKSLEVIAVEDMPEKQKQDGLTAKTNTSTSPPSEEKPQVRSWWRRIICYCDQMDIVGTLVVSAGLALMLVPLTLASSSPDRWASVGVILPICLGFVLFAAFIYYELKWAKHPLVSLRLLKNKSVFFACFGGFFYFFSYYVGRTYFPSYLQVAAGYSPTQAGHVQNVMNFTSVGSGILVGIAVKWSRRVKPFILTGVVCYVAALALLIFVRTPDNHLWALVLGQFILGLGAGLYAGPNQVLVQSHATHQDLGAATALVLVITTLGWTTGAAVAGAIWTNYLPQRLIANLPTEYLGEVDNIVGSIVVAMEYEWGSEVRTAINMSYVEVMRLQCIVGVCLGGVQLLCAVLAKSKPLTDKIALEESSTDGDSAEMNSLMNEGETIESPRKDNMAQGNSTSPAQKPEMV